MKKLSYTQQYAPVVSYVEQQAQTPRIGSPPNLKKCYMS